MNPQTTTRGTAPADILSAGPVQPVSRRMHLVIGAAVAGPLLWLGVTTAHGQGSTAPAQTTTVQEANAGSPARAAVHEPNANQREGRIGQPAVQALKPTQRRAR